MSRSRGFQRTVRGATDTSATLSSSSTLLFLLPLAATAAAAAAAASSSSAPCCCDTNGTEVDAGIFFTLRQKSTFLLQLTNTFRSRGYDTKSAPNNPSEPL